MSGYRSIVPVVTPTDALAMAAQRPVSALTTLIVRNNTQHLIDCSVQQRINWCASTSDDEFGAADEISGPMSGQSDVFGYVFPTSILSEETLPSYDLRIATRCTGTLTDARINARLDVHYVSPTVNTNIATALFDITSASAAWNDKLLPIERSWTRLGSRIAHYSDVGGGAFLQGTPPSFVLVKLTISAAPDDPDDGRVQIIGVHLREYL